MRRRVNENIKKEQIATEIKKLFIMIMEDSNTSTETIGMIGDRVTSIDTLLKLSSPEAFLSDDPYMLKDIMSDCIENYVFENLEDADYKKLMEDMTDDFYDSKIVNKQLKNYKNGKSSSNTSRTRIGSPDITNFMEKFENYLDTNNFSKTLNFITFVRLVNKFKLKNVCIFPSVTDMNQLYSEWEMFIKRR